MDQATTMMELIGAGGDGDAAISAPGRAALDYRGLRAQAVLALIQQRARIAGVYTKEQ